MGLGPWAWALGPWALGPGPRAQISDFAPRPGGNSAQDQDQNGFDSAPRGAWGLGARARAAGGRALGPGPWALGLVKT